MTNEENKVNENTTISIKRETLLMLAKLRYERGFSTFNDVVNFLLLNLHSQERAAMRSGTLPIKAPWKEDKLNLGNEV